jgi:uncharacterized protein (DUF4415 family)
MSEKDKEITYTVTEEEFREELASGLSDDEVMKPGTYKVMRNRFKSKPGDTDLRNCKVKITTYLDADIVKYFKERAEQPNAAPYQTQINNELRKVMENGSTETAAVEREILNDKKFLQALKKKLETV